MSATLNGIRATSAKVSMPAWGCWFAEVSLDGDHTLSGVVTLKVADLTLSGTVLSGGSQLGRSMYRVVAGKGGWGRVLPKKGYSNDAGVKLATVLGDAARAAGEVLAPIDQSVRVGPYYARAEGPASRALQDLAPRGWYVDDAGVTQVGQRAASTLVGSVTRTTPLDKARGKIVLASEAIATIRPGLIVDGLTAVDVHHEISASGGLRSTVWGAASPNVLDSLRSLAEQLDPDRAYRGVTEYRVVTTTGDRLNLQAIRASSGMPDLERVPVRPGVAGCKADVALGSRVLVGFVDSDSSRPYVAAFEDADGEGFMPQSITLAEGVLGVARLTDTVQAGPFAGLITSGSTKVKAG